MTEIKVQLEPYDQGYRDGWRDIHKGPVRRRRKRRARNAEYALGYGHGRTDGLTWGQYPDWQEFSATHVVGGPQPLVWTRRDGAFHAATFGDSSPVPQEVPEVASGHPQTSLGL
jgi:hypothetical protein